MDPPPVIELVAQDNCHGLRRYVDNPHYFVVTSLVVGHNAPCEGNRNTCALLGTRVSSLHQIDEPNSNNTSALFIFDDLTATIEGSLQLRFSLFETRGDIVCYITDIVSSPFQIYSANEWPGMRQSTVLTKILRDRGIRLRVKNQPRKRPSNEKLHLNIT